MFMALSIERYSLRTIIIQNWEAEGVSELFLGAGVVVFLKSGNNNVPFSIISSTILKGRAVDAKKLTRGVFIIIMAVTHHSSDIPVES